MTEQDVAVLDSHAIATVRIGGYKTDGSPAAFTTAAVCDVCGSWATDICTSGDKTTITEDIINSRISRQIRVVVYACAGHFEQVLASLVDDFGYASNSYEPDDLAIAVDRFARLQFTSETDNAP